MFENWDVEGQALEGAVVRQERSFGKEGHRMGFFAGDSCWRGVKVVEEGDIE